jgi:hypothetical protein
MTVHACGTIVARISMLCFPEPVINIGFNLTARQVNEKEIKGNKKVGTILKQKITSIYVVECLPSRSRYRSVSHNIKVKQSH